MYILFSKLIYKIMYLLIIPLIEQIQTSNSDIMKEHNIKQNNFILYINYIIR